jgi:cytochrome c oxidase subunit 4
MDSTATPAAQAHEHHFPERAWQYVKIGLVLFVLTALEVGAYEVAHREGLPLHDFLQTALIPVLIVLSAIKFALVALFYMHLKWDGPLLKGIFSFSLFLATFVILALLALFIYEGKFSAMIGPLAGMT